MLTIKFQKLDSSTRIFLFVFLILFFIDLITTLLGKPENELNPLIKFLWIISPMFVIFYKIFWALIISGGVVFIYPKYKVVIRIMLVISIIAYFMVILRNINILFSLHYKPQI